MKRPAFQFYAADWRGNAKLRRCTHAERGIWIEVMCLMHDSEEYGVLRWPLKDIAQAVNCRMPELRSIVAKDVLKGSEEQIDALIYTPRHAGKDGEPVILLPHQTGPIWYSSRMVRDEYVRTIRGESTRFGEQNAPPKTAPNKTPKPPMGDGSTSSTSTSTSKESKAKTSPAKARASLLPENFPISERVRDWAADKGHDRLEERLEHFAGWARAGGKRYTDWDQCFMNAIRDDWAKLGAGKPDYARAVAGLPGD